jgi:hypothetical protein
MRLPGYAEVRKRSQCYYDIKDSVTGDYHRHHYFVNGESVPPNGRPRFEGLEMVRDVRFRQVNGGDGDPAALEWAG